MANFLKSKAHFFLWLLIALSAFIRPKWEQPHWNSVLTYDPLGYYSYLPAVFIHHDIRPGAWAEEIHKKYGLDIAANNYVPSPAGPVMKYPCGLAMMEAPFFLAAHFFVKATGGEADGFSKPYQFAVSMGGLCAAFIGLFFTRKSLRRYFSEGATAAALLLLALGTNWYHYARWDFAHTHLWLFAVLAALVWKTIRFYEKPALGPAVWIGALLGLATVTRPTELAAIVIPLFWGMELSPKGLTERLSFFQKNWQLLFAAVASAVAVCLPQLIYWKIASGQFLFYSYPGQTFSFLHPHLRQGIFSFRKGWLVYTPVMAFALWGFWFLWKNRRELFSAIALFAGLTIWLVFSWDIWWYGGSFGQRAMVQSYALLVFPLAAFLQFALKSEGRRTGFSLVAAFLIFLNLFQSWQGELCGIGLDAEDTTEAFYKRMFLNFHPRRADLKLLDGRHDYGDLTRENLWRMPSPKPDTSSLSLFEKDSLPAIRCDGVREFTPVASIARPNRRWLRASGSFYMERKEWNIWLGPQFVIETRDAGGKVLDAAYHKPVRLLDEGQWTPLYFDLRLDDPRIERVEIYFWQPTKNSKPIWLRDLRIEAFDEPDVW